MARTLALRFGLGIVVAVGGLYGGYPVPGYNPAPDYPDGQGCLRLPLADALGAYDWLNEGDGVYVYY
jgi:hypothetical protein